MSNDERFEQLYAEHVRAVAGYARARTDRESAIDALARTFEIAWRRLADVPDDPRAWLLGITRRVLADQRRSAGRQDSLIERIGTTLHEPAEDDPIDRLDARERVLAALSELTVDQREALLLVSWDGLSQREAAAVLGCSTGALAVRIHRARKRLRTALNSKDLDHFDGGRAQAPSLNCSPKESL